LANLGTHPAGLTSDSHSVQTGFAHATGTEGYFIGIKRLETEGHHSHPSNADDKNAKRRWRSSSFATLPAA
jgi:hypothetical protein